jgi:glycosyltransferase involved in cell wall biosynthesis
VLLQTVQDFEILVVGDGCTDDSEKVVAEFGDARIRWHNLDRNYGSQWVANNYANEHAASDWIAYLGHDDIWYPTHLDAVLRAAENGNVEAVTSVMALYGPPGSGIRGIAGLFASGSYSQEDFVPPSAFAHAKSLYDNGVRWRDPASVTLPMDAVFLNETILSAKRCASTRELTCFKFNAAWRRDAYKIKSTEEQLRVLERIQSKVDFRHEEFIDIMNSVVDGRFWKIGMPSTAGVEPGWFVRQNRKQKGSDSRFASRDIRPIEAKLRFDLDDQTMPFEWHSVEQHPVHGAFRWSGPGRSSTIDLPVVFDRDLLIRINAVASLVPREAIKILIWGRPLEIRIRDGHDGSFQLEAAARAADFPSSGRDFGITIEVDATRRPCDLGINEDTRWLGAAIGSVDLEPLSTAR